jgi:hypothetical protein
VGKDTATFARALNQAGVETTAVLDPHGRYGVAEFAGLPVTTDSRDPVVVASFSPGLNWNASFGPMRKPLRDPVAAFHFETP